MTETVILLFAFIQLLSLAFTCLYQIAILATVTSGDRAVTERCLEIYSLGRPGVAQHRHCCFFPSKNAPLEGFNQKTSEVKKAQSDSIQGIMTFLATRKFCLRSFKITLFQCFSHYIQGFFQSYYTKYMTIFFSIKMIIM